MEYGLIGYPLKHSYSKLIHKKITDLTKDSYDYELKELDENELDSFLNKRDFKAINVTIPYKEKVIPYLDFISEEAKSIGAVNLIVNKDNKLCGYNTDYFGLNDLIEKNNISIKNKNVIILGTGGTSNTAYALVKKLGANTINKVSRSDKSNINYNNVYNLNDTNVIINTTPVGMYPSNEESIIDLEKFNNLESYIDVVFNPLRTKTDLKAKDLDIKSSSGLYMLVSQAYNAYLIFMNKKKDNSIIDNIYNDIIYDLENIALIGMPSSGKTSVGKEISKVLKRDFIDIDSEIIKETKMEIKDFFKLYGEAKFREIESDIISKHSKKNGAIISCGGGVVLNKCNIDCLKQNSIIVFIDRDLDKLIASDDRPLSNNDGALKKLYNERIDLYKKYADIIVDGNGTIEEVVNNIIKEINL